MGGLPRDKRAAFRRDAWNKAARALTKYQEYPDAAGILTDIVADELAPETGFFSIWMTVFADHPEMLNRFIAAFPGTDPESFDGNGQPRPNGRFKRRGSVSVFKARANRNRITNSVKSGFSGPTYEPCKLLETVSC